MLKNAFLVSLFAAALAHAAVVRLDIKERSDILDGKTFGTVGAYERIVGKAYFASQSQARRRIKPSSTSTKLRATSDGLVEFSSDIFLLRPKNPKKGNGTVLYEVSNRGNKSMLTYFNRAADFARPAQRRRIRRRPADESGLHAAVGRLAVRHAGRPASGVSLSARRCRDSRHRARGAHPGSP